MSSQEHPERQTLFLVYGGLLVLVTLSAIGAKVPLPPLVHTLLVYGLAATTALTLLLVFMEVHYKSGIVRIFVGAGLVWLFLLFLLTLNDYFTRSWRF
jgi:caa(3)-type oxidase subunit IV